jgi:hypothetical protein
LQEWAVVYSRYSLGIFKEGLRRTMIEIKKTGVFSEIRNRYPLNSSV